MQFDICKRCVTILVDALLVWIFDTSYYKKGTPRAMEALMGRVDRHSLSLQLSNDEDEFEDSNQDANQIRYDATGA